jgi:hypothetical protein
LEFDAILGAVKELIEQLPARDRTRLLEQLTIWIDLQEKKPLYNVLDFEGMGKETWKDVDIDEYIRQERASWDKKY